MIIRRKKVRTEKILYLEVSGSNKVCYRIYSENPINFRNSFDISYGIEAENTVTGSREYIHRFSLSISAAMDFCEYLIKNSIGPDKIINYALLYLGRDIDTAGMNIIKSI